MKSDYDMKKCIKNVQDIKMELWLITEKYWEGPSVTQQYTCMFVYPVPGT